MTTLRVKIPEEFKPKGLCARIHARLHHEHYYADWPYSVPARIGGYCMKGCGYHWESEVDEGLFDAGARMMANQGSGL